MKHRFVTQRVTLDITVRTSASEAPQHWDFYDLLQIDGVNDNLDVVSIEDVTVNVAHVKQMEEN